MTESTDFAGIFSTIIAFLALILTCFQLRLAYRPNVVLRTHAFYDRTILEIVNIGTTGAENVIVKFDAADVNIIGKKITDSTIKKQAGCLKELHNHQLQLLPGEMKRYMLYLQEDRGEFAKETVLLHGVVSYKIFGAIRKRKRFTIDVSGNGSAIYEEWPKRKEEEK